MGDQDDYQLSAPVKKTRKYNIWLVIGGIIIVVFLVVGIVFYFLVQKNVNLLNTNTSPGFGIETTDDPFRGGIDANVVIVEFSDFQCPFCFESFPVIREIEQEYGDQIKIIYRDLPVSDIHPDAQKAAEAGECAHEQGNFWAMHDKMFINQSDLGVPALKKYAAEIGLNQVRFDNCLDNSSYAAEVNEDYWDGVAAGATGTPTFFINGTKWEGAIKFDDLKLIIDELLNIYAGEN